MRIATRLWLALSVVIVLVLGVGVSVRIREEQRLLLDVTLRDRRFFAHALQAAVGRGHGSRDPLAEARAMLDEREVAASHIVARLVSRNGAGGLPPPKLRGRLALALRQDDVIVEVQRDEILTYVPLQRGELPIGIELSEPQAVNALLRTVGLKSLILQTGALAALAGLVSFVLVGWLVGRPIGRLVTLARRIGTGDLDARVELEGDTDEVAILAHEMNDMAERLLLARRALEESDTERADALERLRHADRLRTVGQLASALAHELGTPLNVVGGHARIIEEEPERAEDSRASARVILEQTQRMTGILRNLLDFSRRRGPQPRMHELGALAERAIETLAPLARRHRATMRMGSGTPRVVVRADAQQMLQVLSNLLTNAMQAMPEGGEIRVVVDELDAVPPIGVHARAGRYARLAVIDQGTGIDAEDLPQLFEPFFTRKGEGEGTGLGLSVVEGIVRDHGGWVDVTSEAPTGTTFTVYLPTGALDRDEPERPSRASRPGSLRPAT